MDKSWIASGFLLAFFALPIPALEILPPTEVESYEDNEVKRLSSSRMHHILGSGLI